MASLRVVVLQQAVVTQILRLAQRLRLVLQELRAADRKDALAHQAHGVRAGERRRAVADGDVEAVAIETLIPRLGYDAHVDPWVRARQPRKTRNEPQCGEGVRGRD